jgi:hypothetical protein
MAAVDAAAPSDSISVFPGVHHETVDILSKENLVLRAHVPSLQPVITGPPEGGLAVLIRSANVSVLNFVLDGGLFGAGASSGSTIQGNLVVSRQRLT